MKIIESKRGCKEKYVIGGKFYEEQLKEKQFLTTKTMKVNKEGNHGQRQFYKPILNTLPT